MSKKGQPRKTHGKYYTPEHSVWNNMKQRCTNVKNSHYASYGERGISVCERWQKFENFFSDMGKRPTPFHQIERRDNNAGYCPENCIWVLAYQQIRNTTRTVKVTFNGKTLCLKDWCSRLGVDYSTARRRIVAGQTPIRALRLA